MHQSAVGSGLDLPGTSHYLHSCINGKEEVKCGNGNRDEICTIQILEEYIKRAKDPEQYV